MHGKDVGSADGSFEDWLSECIVGGKVDRKQSHHLFLLSVTRDQYLTSRDLSPSALFL